jgi:hypothetical protein
MTIYGHSDAAGDESFSQSEKGDKHGQLEGIDEVIDRLDADRIQPEKERGCRT